jgi:serine/threonine protein kinase
VKKKSPSPHHDDNIGHFQGRAGCIIADRYRINKEKGMGTFARVVECLDLSRQRARPPQLRHDNTGLNSIVAVKIVRNVKRYHDSAIIEADIIEDVNRLGRRGSTHCAILYDSFSFRGHYCMVFESLGPSLYDFLKEQKYHPFPVQCVYDFGLQLLETLEFLHSFRLIHTDLKVKRKLSFMNFLI